MFSSITGWYDRLNSILSLGQDGIWRSKLIGGAALPDHGLVLDICTGSGDLALGFLTQRKDFRGRVYAIDISAPMIDTARSKLARLGAPYPRRVEFLMGDALDMQFPDNKFDVVSCGFGVRNMNDLEQGLTEIHRVLKRGGEADILEFFPDGITSGFVRWYTDRVVPWLGNLLSGTGAYSYLQHSRGQFLSREEFEDLLTWVGFSEIRWERMIFGIAHIVRARKG